MTVTTDLNVLVVLAVYVLRCMYRVKQQPLLQFGGKIVGSMLWVARLQDAHYTGQFGHTSLDKLFLMKS